jgi:uncharacterized protein
MTTREFDPQRLDVAAFAAAGAECAGEWALATFTRLRDTARPVRDRTAGGSVAWRARGERRVVRGGQGQVWLHLGATTAVVLECQRCLGPVDVPLAIERSFLFVHGEDAAAQLDADSDDDVLAMTRALDLQELVEDELLLALPLVPKHLQCPHPLPVPVDDGQPEPAPNPFAVLETLKRKRPLN